MPERIIAYKGDRKEISIADAAIIEPEIAESFGHLYLSTRRPNKVWGPKAITLYMMTSWIKYSLVIDFEDNNENATAAQLASIAACDNP